MRSPLARAILQTVHYADIFDYPLTLAQVERYLIGIRALTGEIEAMLHELVTSRGELECVDDLFFLPGRRELVAARRRLHNAARSQLPRARFYGRLLGCLPFVRMVALTGGLAMENARDEDIDLLIVCAPGRVWTVRAMAVALVRLARLGHTFLCPNYVLSEMRLAIDPQDLYSAHEIAQMIPLYDLAVYQRLRQANPWVSRFLPNAGGSAPAGNSAPLPRLAVRFKGMAERMLAGNAGGRIEKWEMERKIRKLSAQVSLLADGVEFSAEACRGFLSGHARRVLDEYEERTLKLERGGEERIAAGTARAHLKDRVILNKTIWNDG